MGIRNLVCAGLLIFTTMTLGAQQITGSIHGSILDPTGAVVESATVTAKQVETGLSRSANTDRNGNYVLVELPVGHYQLQVAAKGFSKYVQQGITLDVNQVATVMVRLQVGSETQLVDVKADATLLAIGRAAARCGALNPGTA